MTMRFSLAGTVAVAAVLISSSVFAGQNTARAQMRFKSMDADGDGRITRSEWRGSTRSFAVHDWNHDGVLSGDEIRVNARRQAPDEQVDFDSAVREYDFDDWTVRGFNTLDHNRDSRITADEWHFDRETFRRADHNRDGVLSRAEFLNEDETDDDRGDRFEYLDSNGDGRVSRAEWHGTAERFDVLDDNRDGILTRGEMSGNEPPPDLFTSVDVNRDGSITRSEWHWSQRSFDQRDANRDGRLTRVEFAGQESAASRTNAYRAGFERGQVEGRQAGKEDRAVNVWDLEGQRELEQADSGYQPGMGARAEYQAGYREGFRAAYREGFGR
jgi:Ca2+-binding EF-hand superfamily protein